MSRFARCLFVTLPLLTAALSAASAAAQDVRRYIYAAVPGVSNDEQFGGVGILVFDADNGHKFVRRIGTWETYRREAIEPIKGIAAHAATGRLYVSTTRRLAAFDLATDKIVWQKGLRCRLLRSHGGFRRRQDALRAGLQSAEMVCRRCRDRQRDHDHRHRGRGPQHDLFAAHRIAFISRRCARRPWRSSTARPTRSSSASARSAIRRGPSRSTARRSLVYVNVNNLLGVAVGDLQTGKVLHEVSAPGFDKGKPTSARHRQPRHRAHAMTRRKSGLPTGPINYAHIFDATSHAAEIQGKRSTARRTRLVHLQHRWTADLSVERRGHRHRQPESHRHA